MNKLDRNKFEVSCLNAPQGAKKRRSENSFLSLKKYSVKSPASASPWISIGLTGNKLKRRNKFCANDGISLGLLFWKRLGFFKGDIIAMIQGIPERFKHFRRYPFIRSFISWLLGGAYRILTFTDFVQNDFARDFPN